MRTWLDWLNDPRLPAGTLVTWPTLAALYASFPQIGAVPALLAAACVLVIGRLAPTAVLRPLVPVAFAFAAAVLIENEAWGVALVVMVALPVVASALTTLADHRLNSNTG